jgi:hypothetical protein
MTDHYLTYDEYCKCYRAVVVDKGVKIESQGFQTKIEAEEELKKLLQKLKK